ncbi:MAG: glycerol-3-phosphate acyltransferase, partial [Anaerolineales bacterium]
SMSRIITKIVAPDVDLEDTEFKAPGSEGYQLRTISSTTASIRLGPKVGGPIALLDALKGVIPVLVVRFLFPDQYYHLVAGVFSVVGHNWSIFHRFTGGAGLSTAYGAFFAIDFFGTLVSAFSGMLIGFAVFKDMMVAYAGGPFVMIIWLAIFKRDWPHILFAIAVNAVIILKLLPDIIKLIKLRDQTADISVLMEQTSMGRMMKKIMKWMHIDPDKGKTK